MKHVTRVHIIGTLSPHNAYAMSAGVIIKNSDCHLADIPCSTNLCTCATDVQRSGLIKCCSAV